MSRENDESRPKKKSESERKSEPEKKAEPASKATPPWTAYAIVGGIVLVVLWGLTRGSDDGASGGAKGASSSTASDGKLGIDDLVVGTGTEAAKGDAVKVHYVGTLTSGKEFDSSRKHGEPFDFRLGAGEVIKGWDEGVAGMKVGGKRKLTVPPALGYGRAGSPPVIPPDSTLIFEVELLDVTKGSGAKKKEERSEPAPNPDDPLKGKFTLEDATKNIKGTGDLTAKIETSMGTFTCKLLDDKAPITVANFIGLATGERTWRDPKSGKWVNTPAYDGTTFHRVIKGFMIQGGDPLGNGTGEPGYVIKDEIWEGAKHDRIGQLCMANRGHDTNGAQFFITEEPRPNLDGNYTIFGECSPGQLVHDIAKVPTNRSDKPETPVVIKTVKISRTAKP